MPTDGSGMAQRPTPAAEILAMDANRPDDRPKAAAGGQEAGSGLDPAKTPDHPARVFLFSGHMIDRPDRPQPRFPADKAAIAAARIGDALDTLGAAPGDIAFAQAAAGGDILFGEACVERGLRLHILLPLPEADFINASILPSAEGETWRQRYFALRDKLSTPIRILPPSRGNNSAPTNPFALCNRWLLDSALAQGAEHLAFICLWNGDAGDAAGGTADMVKEVEQHAGRVIWLDTRRLW